EVLGLKRVGIEDNFFRIGGNSLTAVKLTAAIRRILAMDVSLAQVFELKTVAGLATQMGQQTSIVIPHIELARYPLSFAQERMLFIEQFEQGTYAYHIPYLMLLDEGVSLSVLESAINQVVERHSVLKMVYRSGGDHTYQQLHSSQQLIEEPLAFKTQLLESVEILWQILRTELATPFNLTTEPGLRLRHYQVGHSHYLLFMWHHIAIDGWSVDIFMHELAEVYHALLEKRDSRLPALEITYGDYAHWQKAYLQGEEGKHQRAYWQQTLAEYEPLLLPTDYPRPAQVDYQGRNFGFTLGSELTGQLKTLAKQQETT
ncbi:condensation domain-containing protein, partial [Xenorhabdus budapestensis]|uniref:condensation domain-containing protein n=1 Tax=Xenorhabdus budapestensis TaxID=290110 RepID=UPI001FCE345D